MKNHAIKNIKQLRFWFGLGIIPAGLFLGRSGGGHRGRRGDGSGGGRGDVLSD